MSQLQTPVNDALREAIGALEVARKAAQDTKDWWTYNELGGLWEDLITIREKTLESNLVIFSDPAILK